MDFMAIPPDEFSMLEYVGADKALLGLTRAELRLVKNIHRWTNHEGHTRPGIDFGQLEMEDYDNYQLSVAFKPPATPVPSPSTPIPTPKIIKFRK